MKAETAGLLNIIGYGEVHVDLAGHSLHFVSNTIKGLVTALWSATFRTQMACFGQWLGLVYCQQARSNLVRPLIACNCVNWHSNLVLLAPPESAWPGLSRLMRDLSLAGYLCVAFSFSYSSFNCSCSALLKVWFQGCCTILWIGRQYSNGLAQMVRQPDCLAAVSTTALALVMFSFSSTSYVCCWTSVKSIFYVFLWNLNANC